MGDSTIAKQVCIRPYTPNDLDFIIGSWLHSMRNDLDINAEKGHGTDVIKFNSMARPLVSRIIDRAGVLIACDPDDYDEIFGYLCAEHQGDRFVGHYVYVKDGARKNHIARLLMLRANPKKNPIITTWTSYALRVKIPKSYNITYDTNMLQQLWYKDYEPICQMVTEGYNNGKRK